MNKAQIRKDWYTSVWEAWPKNKVQVEKEFGNHPFGSGHTTPWLKPHPEVMKDHPLYKEYLANKGSQILITTKPQEREHFKNYSLSNHDLFKLPKGINLLVVDSVLECFSYTQVSEVLVNWYDRLIIGGTICIITPDLKEITKQYVNNTLGYAELVNHLYGTQLDDNSFKSCTFDDVSLRTLMREIGFSQINIEKEGLMLKAIGRKEKEL